MRDLGPIKRLAVVDIETGAKTPDAHIYSVGCAIVNLEDLTVEDLFYTRCGKQDGRSLCVETQSWWLKQASQSPGAFREIFMASEPAPDLKNCLVNFTAWLANYFSSPSEIQMVGNGPEFDNAILLHAFAQFQLPEPWPYWNNQSLRTFKLMHRISGLPSIEGKAFEGTKHHAGDDAYHEACQIIEMLKAAKSSKSCSDQSEACLQSDKWRDATESHAKAWMAVCNKLTNVMPGWLSKAPSGAECAVMAIDQLYERSMADKKINPVFVYQYGSGWTAYRTDQSFKD